MEPQLIVEIEDGTKKPSNIWDNFQQNKLFKIIEDVG